MVKALKVNLDKILPFRDPFLLVDELIHYEPEKKVITRKRLTGKEWFLKGHFPGNPIMPGHLIAESMIQTCSLLFGKFGYDKVKDKAFYLAATKARYFSIVRPGDLITITAYPVKVFSMAGIVRAEAYVRRKLIAKAEFSVALKSKK